jgi:hypothetical protein
MTDQMKIWTTVGSAGTLNQTDLAKVQLHQSIVQLGTDVIIDPGTTARAASVAPRITLPTVQAVVRYNVTPVDGLFPPDPFNGYELKIRYRGQITARLMQVDINTGEETQLIPSEKPPINPFPATAEFQVISAHGQHPVLGHLHVPRLDFVNNAYYVEATLIASELVPGNPAAISIIKIEPQPPQFGG